MIAFRIWFADGGTVVYKIDAVSVYAGWPVVVEKARESTYNGRKREVAKIAVEHTWTQHDNRVEYDQDLADPFDPQGGPEA